MIGAEFAAPVTAGMLGFELVLIDVTPLFVGFEGCPPSVVQPERASVLLAKNTVSEIARILISQG
jgi:hypothetical protein